ncbi:MAG TPA: hypothetical protein VGH87_10810 [Polyangiaceae bacterium]
MRRAVLIVALVACRSNGSGDEARIRAALDVPSDATLISLRASPDDTGFQREGLRIVATFHVKTPTPVFSAPPWSPLPLPTSIAGFSRPPNELAIPASGTFRCEVGVYTTGTSHAMSPCASPLPAHFDMYRIATFDPSTGSLSTLMQFYY